MASNWSVCGVCDYRHITKPSVVWCSECDEGLCEECKDHHSISKGSRNHDTISITEYRKLPNDVLQLARFCDKHNEKYVIFCKKHDCPCCKKCVVDTHNECKELTDIDEITLNIKSSNAFADIEQTLSEIAENIRRLQISREDNLASIGEKSKEIEKEVIETRARINLHLDKLQDAILKDLKTREKEESNKIRRLMKSMTDKEKEIAELQTNIGNIKQYASELQTFLALKHIETDVVAEEKYIQSMVKSDGAKQVDFACKINPSLQGLISAIQIFGDVVVTADSCKIPILNQKDRQAQTMVAITSMTIDSLKPKLLQTIDTKGVGYSEDKLIYCAGKKGIQIIGLGDASIVNVTKTEVTKFSYVATFRDNIFYTDCNEDSVTCIDFKGNTRWVFKNRSVLKGPNDISVDRDGNVYVVAGVSNNVVVISPNGKDCRELLSIENGLKEPVVIQIDRSSCKMLVANRVATAFVFNLK